MQFIKYLIMMMIEQFNDFCKKNVYQVNEKLNVLHLYSIFFLCYMMFKT